MKARVRVVKGKGENNGSSPGRNELLSGQINADWKAYAPTGASQSTSYHIEICTDHNLRRIGFELQGHMTNRCFDLSLTISLSQAKALALKLTEAMSRHEKQFKSSMPEANELLYLYCRQTNSPTEPVVHESHLRQISIRNAFRRASINLSGSAASGDHFDAFFSNENAAAILYDLEKAIVDLEREPGF